jgi:hypothetical protein
MSEQDDEQTLRSLIEQLKTHQTSPNPTGLQTEALDLIANKFIKALNHNADSADRMTRALIALEIIAVTIAAGALVLQFMK